MLLTDSSKSTYNQFMNMYTLKSKDKLKDVGNSLYESDLAH